MQDSSINNSLENSDKKQFWEHHIRSQKQSGLSQTVYCKANNLSHYRFLYWHAKFRDESRRQLIPMTLKSSFAKQVVLCTIELKSGYRLLIHDHTIVTQLLERLS